MKHSTQYQKRRAAIDQKSSHLREKIGFNTKNGSTQSEATSISTFQLLYESTDKHFCLFETNDQHLSAVNATRLA